MYERTAGVRTFSASQSLTVGYSETKVFLNTAHFTQHHFIAVLRERKRERGEASEDPVCCLGGVEKHRFVGPRPDEDEDEDEDEGEGEGEDEGEDEDEEEKLAPSLSYH